MVVGMEVLGATGGASSSPTKSEGDSANTKLYKHTQTLALRKARGIVLGDIFHLTGGCRVRFFVLYAAFMTVCAVITTVRAKKLKSQSK